jgi:hypothetical protein
MTCEKCWGDAYLRMQGDPSRSQTDHYYDLLKERNNGKCTCHHECKKEGPRRG